MKTTAKLFLCISPLLGFFTASCGDNSSTSKDGGTGSGCTYEGVHYEPKMTFTKSGCLYCWCSFDSEVQCYCGDGGIIDARGDATPDLTPLSDGLMSDALGDATPDAVSGDVSVSRDANPADVAADAPVSDLRLASERD